MLSTYNSAGDLNESADKKLEAGTTAPQEGEAATIKGESTESNSGKNYIYWIIFWFCLLLALPITLPRSRILTSNKNDSSSLARTHSN